MFRMSKTRSRIWVFGGGLAYTAGQVPAADGVGTLSYFAISVQYFWSDCTTIGGLSRWRHEANGLF
jgi:hypothetical protein